jgi:hypothetical protein
MNAWIIGRPGSLARFLERSLIMPLVVCASLLGMVGGAQLLGADLPDGTVHVRTIAP